MNEKRIVMHGLSPLAVAFLCLDFPLIWFMRHYSEFVFGFVDTMSGYFFAIIFLGILIGIGILFLMRNIHRNETASPINMPFSGIIKDTALYSVVILVVLSVAFLAWYGTFCLRTLTFADFSTPFYHDMFVLQTVFESAFLFVKAILFRKKDSWRKIRIIPLMMYLSCTAVICCALLYLYVGHVS